MIRFCFLCFLFLLSGFKGIFINSLCNSEKAIKYSDSVRKQNFTEIPVTWVACTVQCGYLKASLWWKMKGRSREVITPKSCMCNFANFVTMYLHYKSTCNFLEFFQARCRFSLSSLHFVQTNKVIIIWSTHNDHSFVWYFVSCSCLISENINTLILIKIACWKVRIREREEERELKVTSSTGIFRRGRGEG